MSDIKISINYGTELKYEWFKFSAGEIQVRVPDIDQNVGVVEFYANIDDSDGILLLMNLRDAVSRRFPNCRPYLILGYLPYGRQDRVCEEGESLGLKVFANIVNSLDFETVIVVDPHSDVAAALIDRCVTAHQVDIFYAELAQLAKEGYVLVSPDAGALKKSFKIAQKYGFPLVRADKVRNTSTGEIIKTVISDNDFHGENCLIVDDICDGGRTFIELAKILKRDGAKSVTLMVTHGIFSKGYDVVLEYVDNIITTDSFPNVKMEPSDMYNHLIKVKPIFEGKLV